MGIKTAKNAFTKDDVIDILKQNVTLYKNEPEFVEYIVNLAMYLMDQDALKSRPETLDDLMAGYEKVRAERAAQQKQETPSADSLDDAELDEPPTNKFRLQQYQPVFKNPPSPNEEQTTAVGSDVGDSEVSDVDSISDELDLDLPKAKQLPSVGILTPEPEGGLDKGPRILVDQTGRTRIYKVVRSYNAQRENDGNCPICGTYVGSSARCQSCGHIL